MGRLVIGIEMAIIIIVLVIISLGGKIDFYLSVVPLVFVVVIPLISTLCVWNLNELIQAFRDAFSTVRLDGNFKKSLMIWTFIGQISLIAGLIGAVMTLMWMVRNFNILEAGVQQEIWRSFILCGLYAILAGLLSRIMHENVQYLSQKSIQELNLEISDAFCKEYSISKREKEVTQLILKGRQYQDVADELSISIKTVKVHVSNVYKKTSSSGRMDLMRLLQFR